VETLTRRIEDAVNEELGRIEAMGGALAAIKSGYFQKELARQQYERTRAIEDGSRVLVGVNRGQLRDERRSIGIFRHDPEVEKRQIARLERLRAERDGDRALRALDRLRDAARTGENLVPPCIEAALAHATHGEMCDALRDVFGEYHPDSLTTGV
jgi:methylmalonyl-CoA mutase N-terminal domain/subunit